MVLIILRRIPLKVQAITCKNYLLKIYSQRANFLNGIYISENFALNLLYTHVLVLAENLFCVNWINTNVYNCLLYTDIQFSRKLTAKFVLCNIQGPSFSRKLTVKFVLCNI